MNRVVVQIEEHVDNSKKSFIILVIRTIFHCVCFLVWNGVMLYGTYVWYSLLQRDIENVVLNDLKILAPGFLTNWNYIFQTIFLGLSLCHDIIEWMDKQDSYISTKLCYWRNVIYNGMVFPFTLFVTAMFWCIYAIDRELVFPKIYDEVVPWWFNQCVHTNITIMVIIETLLQARRHPTDEKQETILHSIIGISYAIVYYSIYYFTGRWLYQVFGVMTWWQVCLFQLLIWSSCYAFYKLQFPINRLIHGSEDATGKTNKGVAEENGKELNNGNSVNGTSTNGLNGTNGNGINGMNGNDNDNNAKIITDFHTPPFSTKSWSVKYRSVRNQFEKSHL